MKKIFLTLGLYGSYKIKVIFEYVAKSLDANHQKYLTQIIKLRLDENCIEKIDTEIFNLTELKLFSIYKNQLTNLPKELFKLINLERLNLSVDKLTFL